MRDRLRLTNDQGRIVRPYDGDKRADLGRLGRCPSGRASQAVTRRSVTLTPVRWLEVSGRARLNRHSTAVEGEPSLLGDPEGRIGYVETTGAAATLLEGHQRLTAVRCLSPHPQKQLRDEMP